MGRNQIKQTTQLSIKSIMLINVKMPTIVGILTFISMINTTSEKLHARNFFRKFCQRGSDSDNFFFDKMKEDPNSTKSQPAKHHLNGVSLVGG